jgi:hypothetical protein
MAVGSDRVLRYAAYRSAIDREEATAKRYAAMTLRLSQTSGRQAMIPCLLTAYAPAASRS